MDAPWEHPDWYDLHDTAFSAGSEREPEHYRELLLALPPLGPGDHLADLGAGTGKLACVIARGYPEVGRVTLVEPNEPKLARARARLADLLPRAEIRAVAAGLGEGAAVRVDGGATVATVGSVLMPIMELRGGTLRDGLAWVARSLGEIRGLVRPGGALFLLETLALPWARGGLDAPARRLTLPELSDQVAAAGFAPVECVYRFRDRVVLRASLPHP
jgi:SAM-dependent methyltransferase